MKKIILAIIAGIIPLVLPAAFLRGRWIILQLCACYYAG